jgi:hypothetical protein
MKRLIALGVLALFTFGAVLAVRRLPWWTLVLGFLALILVGKFVIKLLLKKLLLMPFRAKGAVLKGASARIHAITPAASPVIEGSSGVPLEHYLVEVTITPGATEGPFGLWEPGELRLVRPESVLHPESDETDGDGACTVTKIQIEDEGRWSDDEGMKYGGPQRLRMNLAAQPGTRELKFRYYFEEFGKIKLV